MPGSKRLVVVGHGRLDLHVAGAGLDLGIDRTELAGERAAGIRIQLVRFTFWPTCRRLSSLCGTWKSTNSGSSCCRVTTAVPALR